MTPITTAGHGKWLAPQVQVVRPLPSPPSSPSPSPSPTARRPLPSPPKSPMTPKSESEPTIPNTVGMNTSYISSAAASSHAIKPVLTLLTRPAESKASGSKRPAITITPMTPSVRIFSLKSPSLRRKVSRRYARAGETSKSFKPRTVRPLPPHPPLPATFSVALPVASMPKAAHEPSKTTSRKNSVGHNSQRSLAESLIISPLSASIPVRPSPSVARRKRMSKLRRHLGEPVSESMVTCTRAPVTVKKIKPTLPHIVIPPSRKPIAIAENPVVSDSSSELWSTDDERDARPRKAGREKGNDKELSEGNIANVSVPMQNNTFRNYSKKWLKEKSGRRVVQDDLGDVLRRLRALH